MKPQLTAEQYEKLLDQLPQFRVQNLRGQSHLEAWDVRRTLIRIFGFGGFDVETISCEQVAQLEHAPGTIQITKWVGGNKTSVPNADTRWTVVYRAQVRLIIKAADGTVFARYEDGATGDSSNQPSLGDAHDMAMKTALSQALKRCAVNLGDQFGLSLYNGGKTNAVVNRTLVGGPGTAGVADLPHDEAPVQGEPEPQRDISAEPEPEAESAENRLTGLIAAATDKDQLGAAWKAIVAAMNAGAITVEQRDALQEAWKRRKGEVMPKNPGNDAHRRRMMALFGQVEEMTDRGARLQFVADVTGRDIATTNQLTDDEVQKVIGRLERWIRQSTPPADAELAGAGAR
ncbi:Rad52/Rad22 family DNA repair protein [Actinoplanes sp. CA-252034]|uniref:Rad52/Rad22 family DNA repair protein n=1 Tax=Actinoplanes sp. CA-252034 TaxID=3239906 RepID=UPI003D994466